MSRQFSRKIKRFIKKTVVGAALLTTTHISVAQAESDRGHYRAGNKPVEPIAPRPAPEPVPVRVICHLAHMSPTATHYGNAAMVRKTNGATR